MSEPISPYAFREALARFASGVTVITAVGPGGPVGFTASAFSSVSLTPPLVLVCIAKRASAHDGIASSETFGVSVLDEQQAWIAAQFGRSGVDRFQAVPLRRDARVPLVDGAIAQLECRRYATHDAGDHTILVGEVVHSVVTSGRPLVHFDRKLGGFAVHGGET